MRARSDEALTTRVRAIHAHSRGSYGAPRIQAELAEQGTPVSRTRGARVMRQAGLAGVSRRKGPRTTRRDAQARPAPDWVEREFHADAPAESFFATLERELLDRTHFHDHHQARRAIFEFIEGWYNPHRRHQGLGQQPPIAFERSYQNAA